jgi:sterol desaturase/sphingolipid hydroxylase (fatty acid hydroxylase superfamily)
MSQQTELRLAARPGGYRPEEPIRIGPPFQWPPQPIVLFKWLFGFPGYLWPWTALYAAIAFVWWRYLTLDMSAMQIFSVDWIAPLLLGNLALLVAVVSAWHGRLYVGKAQGTDYKYNSKWLAAGNPSFLFRNQLWDNVFWSVCSAVPIWTAYEAVTFWLHANGYVPEVSWQTQPIYCALLVLLTPLWLQIHFYFTHRFIHWTPLYRAAHFVHHKNINPGPWSGLAMHPLEHLIYFSGVALYWIVPSHPLHSLYALLALALSPAIGHLGFDRLVLGKATSLTIGEYMHYLHHKYVQVNYGTGLIPLDRWLGTFHDGSDAATEALKKRMRGREES